MPILNILNCNLLYQYIHFFHFYQSIILSNIALANCEGIIFVFSCGRSHIPFTCCCDHTSRVGLLPLKESQVTLLRRNALNHFVHWRFPRLLFLDEVPHGRDINHFMITSFFVALHPTSRRLPYVYVGVSPFPSVLLFGAIQIIFLYLLFSFLLNVCYFVPFIFTSFLIAC